MAKTLAVIYRPTKFEDVSEQKNVIGILKNQLENKECKNAYLFCGGAGTGKTTCARIFANELNGGKSVPVEIDGASNNGVENVRGIIEQARFMPLEGQYKVYIIDECHMLSIGAWNAMLKLLEEPPARTVFIFCTTDPQKIPATILSRVQKYDFNRISTPGIVARLKYICEQEKLKASDDALEFLARLAAGGMRDAISLMDKCFSYSKELTLDNVTAALGLVSYDCLFTILDNVIKKQSGAVLKEIDGVYQHGLDIKQFIKSFITFMIDVSIFKASGRLLLSRLPETYLGKVNALVNDVDMNDILDFIDELFKLQALIKYDPAPLPLVQAFFIKFSTGVKK